MKTIPPKERRAWFLKMREPSLTDWYIMQLTNTVRSLAGGAVSSLSELMLVHKSASDDLTIKSREYVEMRQREAKAAAEMGVENPGERPNGLKRE